MVHKKACLDARRQQLMAQLDKTNEQIEDVEMKAAKPYKIMMSKDQMARYQEFIVQEQQSQGSN
jgi:hypothetical protein